MSRNAYLVSYDIADDARRRQVYGVCRGYGERVQYSVFRCHLDTTERIDFMASLEEVIHHDQDQVLFADLGPVDGRSTHCIRVLGRAHTPPDESPIIV